MTFSDAERGAQGLIERSRLGVAVLIVSLAAGCMATSPSSVSTVQTPAATFPSEIAGMPVVTVARAVELIRSGRLDGQVVAVAGYYGSFYASCPYPGRYIGPLQRWCSFHAFTDTRSDAQLCQPEGSNGIGCHQPTGTSLSPFFMSESSGSSARSPIGGATLQPAALVVIGHAGDPRQWQCTASTQVECANAFVVDRIAWAEGQDVPVGAPETGDQHSGTPITPKMTLAEVGAALGLTDNLLTGGAAFKAGDIAAIDPRWDLAGDEIVWLVRSLDPVASSPIDETRSGTVWLLGETTAKVIDHHSLKVDAAYQPGRLWSMATVHAHECCADNLEAFTRVLSSDGTLVYEGLVSGSATGGDGYTTFGGGYGSPPIVLRAGDYRIETWLADYAGGAMGAPTRECSTQVTLGRLDNITMSADFPAGQACILQPAPVPSPS